MTTLISQTDYAETGLNIQSAMLVATKALGKKPSLPFGILWSGKIIQVGDQVAVPQRGCVRLELLHYAAGFEQGVDIKTKGGFELADGKVVPLLRTWADSRFEDDVEYPYTSSDGILHVWNVFKRRFPGGEVREERWTGNAGLWVEKLSSSERIYHCSHGMVDSPDFESLQFKLSVRPV